MAGDGPSLLRGSGNVFGGPWPAERRPAAFGLALDGSPQPGRRPPQGFAPSGPERLWAAFSSRSPPVPSFPRTAAPSSRLLAMLPPRAPALAGPRVPPRGGAGSTWRKAGCPEGPPALGAFQLEPLQLIPNTPKSRVQAASARLPPCVELGEPLDCSHFPGDPRPPKPRRSDPGCAPRGAPGRRTPGLGGSGRGCRRPELGVKRGTYLATG